MNMISGCGVTESACGVEPLPTTMLGVCYCCEASLWPSFSPHNEGVLHVS